MWAGGSADATDEEAVSGSNSSICSMLLHCNIATCHFAMQRQKTEQNDAAFSDRVSGRLPSTVHVSIDVCLPVGYQSSHASTSALGRGNLGEGRGARGKY